MGTFNINPTNNQSPDATLGGDAVSSPTNTGHASSTAAAADPIFIETLSCRWFDFRSTPTLVRRTLKIDHQSDGTLLGIGSKTNEFTLSYSLNGGGSWTNAVSRTNFTSLQSGTFSVDLDPSQDTTQVQVRDFLSATAGLDTTASATATVSNIRIENVFGDLVD